MRRTKPEREERERVLNELKHESEGRAMEPAATDHEPTLTVKQFARRVHRNHRTIYRWINAGLMPGGSVVDVMGHTEIVWKIFAEKGGIKTLR